MDGIDPDRTIERQLSGGSDGGFFLLRRLAVLECFCFFYTWGRLHFQLDALTQPRCPNMEIADPCTAARRIAALTSQGYTPRKPIESTRTVGQRQ